MTHIMMMMRTRQHSSCCWRRRAERRRRRMRTAVGRARERLPPLQTHGNAVKEKLFMST